MISKYNNTTTPDKLNKILGQDKTFFLYVRKQITIHAIGGETLYHSMIFHDFGCENPFISLYLSI